MSIVLLSIVVVSWGLSWYAITLQLGEAPALVSVAYRFLLAAALLTGWLTIKKEFKPLPLRQHGLLFGLGFCLFSANFYCFYLAAAVLPSGLLSVVFATAAVMGAVNQKVFFGKRLEKKVLLGAALGAAGLALIFYPGIADSETETRAAYLLLPLLGTYLFSLGNLASVRLSSRTSLANAVAHGMLYGAGICVAGCLLTGQSFVLPTATVYWAALLYLSVIASVVAFLSYLALVNRAGPERAAYATVLFPIVAMLASTAFEGYVWTAPAAAGIALALCGTYLVFFTPPTASARRSPPRL